MGSGKIIPAGKPLTSDDFKAAMESILDATKRIGVYTLDSIKDVLPAGVSLEMLAAEIIKKSIDKEGELQLAAELHRLLGDSSASILGQALLVRRKLTSEEGEDAIKDSLQQRIQTKLKGKPWEKK